MDNCTQTLGQLLGELHISHSKRFIADNVQSHPLYPSFFTNGAIPKESPIPYPLYQWSRITKGV
jgi:hypothetical protein